MKEVMDDAFTRANQFLDGFSPKSGPEMSAMMNGIFMAVQAFCLSYCERGDEAKMIGQLGEHYRNVEAYSMSRVEEVAKAKGSSHVIQ